MRVSIDGERDDVVTALEVNLDVTTRADDDVVEITFNSPRHFLWFPPNSVVMPGLVPGIHVFPA